MKVILLNDVKALGKANAIVEVSDGYAQNFLFKKKLALPATAENLNSIKNKLNAQEAARQRELEEARELGKKLAGQTITLEMKAGEGGRLYGAVTAQEVAAALAEKGFQVDKKNISISTTLKNVGRTSASLKLHQQVKVDITLEIKAL